MHGAGDRGRVAADLGAVAIQQCAATDRVVDVAPGNVPQVSMLGHHAQNRARPSTDQDRGVGMLKGLGLQNAPDRWT